MSNEYDIVKAFQRIEETLIKSMKRNLTRHMNEEKDLGMNWSAWQAEQIKSLEQFKKDNKKLFKKDFSTINSDIEELITKSFEDGKLNQEKVILEAIREGNFSSNDKEINKLWNIYKKTKNNRIKKKQLSRIYSKVNQAESTFFKINERKLKALINETTENFEKAEMSILRYSNDQYRKIIYDAQVYANTGSGTVQQAVDMATKDFLSKGINSIQYANGAMVNIASYAEMAIRTANKRAYLQGEGTKRAEWGVHTVLVPNRGGGCPYCIKFQGKVFIDDVWSNGTEAESKNTKYPLLSEAVKARLFHPNCKDTTVTYFPGINSEVEAPTEEQLKEKTENYIKEQKLKYIERNIEKYERLELGSTDSANIEKYHNKKLEWIKYKERFKQDSSITFKDIEKTEKNDIINNNIETIGTEKKEKLQNILIDMNEARRKHWNLNLLSKEEIQNSHYKDLAYSVDLEGIDEKIIDAITENYEKLGDEYYTTLTHIGTFDEEMLKAKPNALGYEHIGVKTLTGEIHFNQKILDDYDSYIGTIEKASKYGYLPKNLNPNNYKYYVPTHEFAHSIFNSNMVDKNLIGMDNGIYKNFGKELETKFELYKAKINELNTKIKELNNKFVLDTLNFTPQDSSTLKLLIKERNEIFVSDYAIKDNLKDEFMAECFTDVKLSDNPSKTSLEVIELIDKYFKR